MNATTAIHLWDKHLSATVQRTTVSIIPHSQVKVEMCPLNSVSSSGRTYSVGHNMETLFPGTSTTIKLVL
jgi:hypothetical protein